ncbi:N-acetylmuramoyl-L-alanine amidase-like domain-containing protein [Mangrovibacterium lignilyticum]|uniref:N-acetylmuramoyl-L-alanine amidase-like domain-containing protein n=1 Tax=Mangrovibacterium lignilyticum TaxID=2668052 RepID=UPI0013D4FCD6|nr:N-acetylmuramoyl-L-alanine amidase-like domain-containing protein [Mangrovibacterium lignilyticum]
MKIFPLIILVFAFTQACNSQNTTKKELPIDLVACKADSILLQEKMVEFATDNHLPTGELVFKIGKSFLGSPYVSHTLETGKDEKLVVNLRELDCTTFDETCLALALTIKAGKTDFGSYAGQLEQVRYRNGIRNGYLSRLHYFSDWLYNNSEKGLVSPLDKSFQSSFNKNINFMSTHPASYPVLKSNPELVAQIAKQEKTISSREFYFLPKENLKVNEKQLQDGDFVGITTSIAGLDIAHVGLVIWVDGRVHLLHASSALEKVVISDQPLADYLAAKKSFTGIMIARPQ